MEPANTTTTITRLLPRQVAKVGQVCNVQVFSCCYSHCNNNNNKLDKCSQWNMMASCVRGKAGRDCWDALRKTWSWRVTASPLLDNGTTGDVDSAATSDDDGDVGIDVGAFTCAGDFSSITKRVCFALWACALLIVIIACSCCCRCCCCCCYYFVPINSNSDKLNSIH